MLRNMQHSGTNTVQCSCQELFRVSVVSRKVPTTCLLISFESQKVELIGPAPDISTPSITRLVRVEVSLPNITVHAGPRYRLLWVDAVGIACVRGDRKRALAAGSLARWGK